MACPLVTPCGLSRTRFQNARGSGRLPEGTQFDAEGCDAPGETRDHQKTRWERKRGAVSAAACVVLVDPLAVGTALDAQNPVRVIEVPAHRGEQTPLDVVALRPTELGFEL